MKTFVSATFVCSLGALIGLMLWAVVWSATVSHPRHWVVVGGTRTLIDFGAVPDDREAKAACQAAAAAIWNGYCDRYPGTEK